MTSVKLWPVETSFGLDAVLSTLDEVYHNLYLIMNRGLHLVEADAQSYFIIETALVLIPVRGTINAR